MIYKHINAIYFHFYLHFIYVSTNIHNGIITYIFLSFFTFVFINWNAPDIRKIFRILYYPVLLFFTIRLNNRKSLVVSEKLFFYLRSKLKTNIRYLFNNLKLTETKLKFFRSFMNII